MRPVLLSGSRALLSQFHYRMLLLSVLPFVLSVAIWGVILWLGLQPLVDTLQAWFTQYGWFSSAGNILNTLGLDALKTVLVPLLAMWLFLPLMILTALIIVGTLAMPIIVRHIGRRKYPGLEEKKGGTLFGTVWISFYSFIIFAILWIVTLPLTAIPPFTFLIQPLLWGWLTYRVMAYDALSLHASADEIKEVMRRHHWSLLVIGVIAGAMGAAPTLLWLGGVISIMLFPLLAAGAIWLYVLVFIFSGLWFTYFSLSALQQLRQSTESAAEVVPQAIPKLTED